MVLLVNEILSSVQSLSHVRHFVTPMDCSTPGFPFHHQFPELTQTHVHWVGDVIQPSHPLSSPSPTFNLSQHQGLLQWVSSLHQVAKVFELQHQFFKWVSLQLTDWISLQSKGLSRVFANTTIQKHQFFGAQHSYGPAIPLLGIYPEETKIEKDTCIPLFVAALFTIARTWKQPRCPSTDEWIKKCGTYTQWNIQFSSVTQLCPTLCDPMNHSTLGHPVHHQLLEFTETYVHQVGDAIQASHPVISFSSCPQSLPASESFPMSQLFAWGGQSIGVSPSSSVLPVNT